MSTSSPRLGRGLGALISSPGTHSAAVPATGTDAPGRLPLESIVPNRFQPRADFSDDRMNELANSIRSSGVLQPVVVRPLSSGRFELIAGERRLRAAKMAGLSEIPVIVRAATDREAFQLALIENLQREDLGPLERARAYQSYIEAFGGTAEDLGALLSESRSSIVNYLRLLKLQPEVAFMLGHGDLSMGQARALAGIDDEQRQLALARLVSRRNLSVRQVEALVRSNDAKSSGGAGRAGPPPDRHLSEVEAALSKAIGLRVRLRSGRKLNSGQIVIHFSTLDEFERVAARLGGVQLAD